MDNVLKINLVSNVQKKTFLLFHAFSSSSTDFNYLVNPLRDAFGANIIAPLLPGHGTSVDDLRSIKYIEMYKKGEEYLLKELEKGNQVILGGVSVGGLIALELASKYPVNGVWVASIPWQFQKKIRLAEKLRPILPVKEYKKPEHNLKKRVEFGAFTYPAIPLTIFDVVKDAKERISPKLHQLTCPILIVQNSADHVADIKGADDVLSAVSSKVKFKRFYGDKDKQKGTEHNILFSHVVDDVLEDLINFSKNHGFS